MSSVYSFLLSAFLSSFISSSRLTPSLPVCLSPPPPCISFGARKGLDNRYHSTKNLFLLHGTLKTLGEEKIAHAIFCLLKSHWVRSSIFFVCWGECVENIALEQWPCLRTALWGGLQTEDPGSLQGLLGVHPTGDRRVTSSPDGAPAGPLPDKPGPQSAEPGSQPCCWLWIL